MASSSTPRPYYPALDGLRGLAILLVVGFHNFDFIKYFSFGWLGVDLFFVLSGFLITRILLDTRNRPNFLRNFYLRRILRIAPLYYLLLLVFFLLFPLLGIFREPLRYYQMHQAWFWVYLQNWLYIIHPIQGSNLLIHLWSLAVEEQFYLLWPFLLLWIRRPRVLLRLVGGMLATLLALRILLWFLLPGSVSHFNVYIFTRVDGILVGCLLALLQSTQWDFIRRHTAWIVLGLSAMNFLFYFLNRARMFSFPYFAFVGYTTFAVMFGLLVYEAARGENRLVRLVFGQGPLPFLGRVSYGFYLFFWPVFVLLTPPAESWLRDQLNWGPFASHLAATLLTTLLGFCLSIASFYYYESRFLAMKKYFA